MKRAAAIVLVVLLGGLSACATHRGDDENAPPSLVPPADVAQPANPAVDARFNELQTSMTELLERLDVLNARIARLESGQSEARPAVAAATPAPRIEPPPAPQQPAARAAAAPPPAPQPVVTPAPIASAPPSSALAAAGIADDYRGALILYGKGRMGEARAALQKVFDADPSGELADNALYWIGETYFAAADYQTALRFYERVTREYPEQNKAPDAMLKIGLTYAKTGDLGVARKTFDDLIRRYPYSTAAATAKLEQKRIKY